MENKAMCDRPDMDDLPHREWKCEHCGAANSMWDGDCQYCDHVDEVEDDEEGEMK
jgi:predicted ATP-dependent serine protease